MEWLKTLYKNGNLIGCGGGEFPEYAGGLTLIKAASLDDAKSSSAGSPMNEIGTTEIMEWEVYYGNLNEKSREYTLSSLDGDLKRKKYIDLLPQIKSFSEDIDNPIGSIGNTLSILKYSMPHFFWLGVYFKKDNQLILGPFQGPPACSPITIPNGVCGQSVTKKETIIVPDVNKFEGHIACSSESKSEIVIPLRKN